MFHLATYSTFQVDDYVLKTLIVIPYKHASYVII